MKTRFALLALLLLPALTARRRDDDYVLWRRYNGPGGNFWRIDSEFDYNYWRKGAGPGNRQHCERVLEQHRQTYAELVEQGKKAGKTIGETDFVCLPKGMHP